MTKKKTSKKGPVPAPAKLQKRAITPPGATLVRATDGPSTEEEALGQIMALQSRLRREAPPPGITVPIGFATAGWGIGQLMNPKSDTAPLVGSILGGLLGLLVTQK